MWIGVRVMMVITGNSHEKASFARQRSFQERLLECELLRMAIGVVRLARILASAIVLKFATRKLFRQIVPSLLSFAE